MDRRWRSTSSGMLFPSNQEMPVRQIACANSFSVTEYYPSIPMALAILLFVTTVSAFGQGQFERKGTPLILSDSWTATDALGRKLPDHNSVGDMRPNRSVALFYWTWHVDPKTDMGPANVQQIISENPLAANDYHHTILQTVVAYCALGCIANAMTTSADERKLCLPVVVCLLACSLIVAIS